MTKMAEQMDAFERRRALRQKRIRRRRAFIALWTTLIILLLVGLVLCLTVLFPIEKVSASGSKLYTEKQIVQYSGLNSEDNVFSFSREKTQERLRERLPYVDSAKFELVLPDTVKIKVTDAKEHFAFKKGNSFYVISTSGYVLKKTDELQSDIPNIIGVQGSFKVSKKAAYKEEKKQQILEMALSLFEENKISVQWINLTDTLDIQLKVENRFVVNLGASSELEGKIRHLSGMIKSMDEESTGNINLSMWNSSKKEGSFVRGSIE